MTSGERGDNILMVAAMDFGTTNSRYVFGTREGLKNDSPEVMCPIWKGQQGILTSKVPTTVLLNENKQFMAFVYEAEEQYANLGEREEHEEYYYFPNFKMMLYDKVRKERLTLNTTVQDIRGKELPAIDVFSHAIRYMKNHLLENLQERGMFSVEKEISWILTIPAIWGNPGKHFMRKAAKKAEIDATKLTIALESAAAIMWCTHLPVEKLHGFDEKFSLLAEGSRYLVLDARGETIDITVHEVKAGGKLKELERASWRDWGGESVDKAFKKMLCDIVGGEGALDGYIQSYPGDYLELFRCFKIMKRIKTVSTKITVPIPYTFPNTFPDIELRTSQSVYKEDLQWRRDKLRIRSKTFERLFEPACEGIIEHINEVLRLPTVREIHFILMVGGFTESPALQNAIKKAFPNLNILIPQEASLAVLRGAVLMHDKEILPNEGFVGIESKCIERDDTILLQIIPDVQKSNQRDVKNAELSVSLFKTKNKNSTRLEDSDCNYMGNISVPVRDSTHEFKVTVVHGGRGENVTVEVSTASGFKTDIKFDCK